MSLRSDGRRRESAARCLCTLVPLAADSVLAVCGAGPLATRVKLTPPSPPGGRLCCSHVREEQMDEICRGQALPEPCAASPRREFSPLSFRSRRWAGSSWGSARWARGAALTSSTAWRSGCCPPCPSRCSASRRHCASTPAPTTTRVRLLFLPEVACRGQRGLQADVLAAWIRNKGQFNCAAWTGCCRQR